MISVFTHDLCFCHNCDDTHFTGTTKHTRVSLVWENGLPRPVTMRRFDKSSCSLTLNRMDLNASTLFFASFVTWLTVTSPKRCEMVWRPLWWNTWKGQTKHISFILTRIIMYTSCVTKNKCIYCIHYKDIVCSSTSKTSRSSARRDQRWAFGFLEKFRFEKAEARKTRGWLNRWIIKDHIERFRKIWKLCIQKIGCHHDRRQYNSVHGNAIRFFGDPKTLRRAPEGDPVAPKRTAQALHKFFSEKSLNVIYYYDLWFCI